MKCGKALNDCIVNKIAGQLFIINSHPNFKGENKRQRSPFLSGIPRQVRLDPGRDLRGDRLRGVKMNIDTKMQYAFTRAIADHMFKHYDSVLKVDWEVGSKKT